MPPHLSLINANSIKESNFFFRIQCLKENYKQLQLDKISLRMCVKYKMYFKSN